MKKFIIVFAIIAIAFVVLYGVGINLIDNAVTGYCTANGCDFIGYIEVNNDVISFVVDKHDGMYYQIDMPNDGSILLDFASIA